MAFRSAVSLGSAGMFKSVFDKLGHSGDVWVANAEPIL